MTMPDYWDDATRELAARDTVLSKLATRYPARVTGILEADNPGVSGKLFAHHLKANLATTASVAEEAVTVGRWFIGAEAKSQTCRGKRQTPPTFRPEGRVALATNWNSGGMASGVPPAQ